MSDDEIEVDKMRNALSNIASEMQKFHNETASSGSNEKGDEILHKLIKCKTSLNLRKIQVKTLKQNLKTACVVAKTMSSAKATETASLNNHLDLARKQYVDILEQQNEKNEIIQNLSSENSNLRNQVSYFMNVIRLGYNELQKIRNESVENISTLEQLRHIIVCCGQYYADHSNEHEKCIRLEQRNRFLTSKLFSTENNLHAASEELRNLRFAVKPYKETKGTVTRSRQCIGVVCSEYKIDRDQSTYTNLTMTKIKLNNHSLPTNRTDLDLTYHLKTVKKLLHDQDNLIKDLKKLSNAINTDESSYLKVF